MPNMLVVGNERNSLVGRVWRPLSTLVTEIHTDPTTNHIIIREYLQSLPNTVMVIDATKEIGDLNKLITTYRQTVKKTKIKRTKMLVARIRLRTLYWLLHKKYACELLGDGRLVNLSRRDQERPPKTRRIHPPIPPAQIAHHPLPSIPDRGEDTSWPDWLQPDWGG